MKIFIFCSWHDEKFLPWNLFKIISNVSNILNTNYELLILKSCAIADSLCWIRWNLK